MKIKLFNNKLFYFYFFYFFLSNFLKCIVLNMDVIIEIPLGENVKYELENGSLRCDRIFKYINGLSW